jgi:hypothetical protein
MSQTTQFLKKKKELLNVKLRFDFLYNFYLKYF